MKRNANTGTPVSDQKRQRTIDVTLNTAQTPIFSAETQAQHAPLDLYYQQTLVQCADYYLKVWSSRCAGKNRAKSSALQGDGDLDLDFAGLRFLEAFRHVVQDAVIQKEVINPRMVEVIILILRNDCFHQHTQVSRQAYNLIRKYLTHFPYSWVEDREAGPCIVTSSANTAVWFPLDLEFDGFSSKFIMVRDLKVAGDSYHQINSDGAVLLENKRRDKKLNRYETPHDLVLDFFQNALNSDDLDRNGDLMLLCYLVRILEEDLAARLTVFNSYRNLTNAKDISRRNALLEHSLLWRVSASELVSSSSRQDMIHTVMKVIASAEGVVKEAEGVSNAHGDEEDKDDPAILLSDALPDAQAFPCIMTRRELAAVAARFLRAQLELFGTAEDAGMFLSTSRVRSAGTNHRSALDEGMLSSFLGPTSVCNTEERICAFLACLPHRDKLRCVGLHIARQFARTYESEAKGGLQALLDSEAMLRSGGRDAVAYQDVDLVSAVKSITLENGIRAIKVYKRSSIVAILLFTIATSSFVMKVQGMQVPCGKHALGDLASELKKAFSIVISLHIEHGHRDAAYHLPTDGTNYCLYAEHALEGLVS